MTRRKPSASSSNPLKKSSARASNRRARAPKRNLGDEIIRGLEEVLDHLQGRTKLRTRTIVVPDVVVSDTIDVHAIREKSGLSQFDFAARYGFSFRTLQEWEQGRACPDGAVRAYLTVIDRNPEAVQQALAC